KNVTLDINEGINVFEVDPSGGINLNFDGTSNSTIILKATNNTVEIKDTYVNGVKINNQNIDSIINRVIWVFEPNTVSIDVNQTHTWIGSVLAAKADVKLHGGYSSINGTIIANSLDASNGSTNSEFHYTGRFIGKLPTSDPSEPSEEKATPVAPKVEDAYCDEDGNEFGPIV